MSGIPRLCPSATAISALLRLYVKTSSIVPEAADGPLKNSGLIEEGDALPYVTERGRIRELSQPGGQKIRVLAPPIHFPGECYELTPAPTLGGDTDAVLEELGYDAETCARLRENGVG